MTLNTTIHLRGEIAAGDAFDLALRALLTSADEMDRYEGAIIERTSAGSAHPWAGDASGHMPYDYICTQLGQGLPGITEAKGYPDGREFIPDVPDEDGDVWGDQENWVVQLSWDTGYAYTGKNGESCSMLHGAALILLHRALPEGVTMRWENEFTGEWHDGVAGLEEFMGEGHAAKAFAASTLLVVQAAVDAEAAGGEKS